MYEVRITVSEKVKASQIEMLCAQLELTCTMRGELKSIASNLHWHFKKAKLKGVMEITLMKETGEIILSVHDNRRGAWEEEVMKKVKSALEK